MADQVVGPTIQVLAFDDLDPRTAYRIWRLRQDVFVVEQECPYPDLDGRDDEPGTRHVVMFDSGGGRAGSEAPVSRLVGYLRILDEGDHARIGRVALDPAFRGRGLADRLMASALDETGDREVLLSAQAPLADWYASHGFEVCGEPFLEDGISHLPMLMRDSGI